MIKRYSPAICTVSRYNERTITQYPTRSPRFLNMALNRSRNIRLFQILLLLFAQLFSIRFDRLINTFTTGKADAGLAASIFHFKEIEIPDLKRYLRGKGIEMRI